MQIRPAKIFDLPACLEIDHAVTGNLSRSGFLDERIRLGRLYVAELEFCRIAGFITFEKHWFDHVFVSWVCVHPEYRRKGIANRLFKTVERLCENGKLFSSTEETNLVSIKLHKKLGFRESGYIENLYSNHKEIIFCKLVTTDHVVKT